MPINKDYIIAACKYAKEKKVEVFTAEENYKIINLFMENFKSNRAREHPELSKEQIRKIILQLPYYKPFIYAKEKDLCPDDYTEIIKAYFKTDFQTDCNYHIFHFMSGNIRRNKQAKIKAKEKDLKTAAEAVPMPEYIKEMPFYKKAHQNAGRDYAGLSEKR